MEPSTCWDLLRGAADGDRAQSERFAACYASLIHDYLQRRWQGRWVRAELEDAVQETLLECLRDQGALRRALDGGTGRFRPFLFGVCQNVARRVEFERARAQRVQGQPLPESRLAPGDEVSPSIAFDQAWARNVVRRAREELEQRAAQAGERERQRSELLRLRFLEGLPIREIASRWKQDAAHLHHEYARARDEFREALLRILRFEAGDRPGAAEEELQFLMQHLS